MPRYLFLALLTVCFTTAYSQAVQAQAKAEAQVQRLGQQVQMQQWSNPMGQSLGWLAMPQIQKELEIIADQQERLDKIRSEITAKMQEMYKSLTGEPAERQTKYYELSKELGEEADKKVKAVLLPHQLKRLQQIGLQMKMQYAGYGSASALTSDDVLSGLGLTAAQKDQLKQREEEVRQEMQQKTQEFYKKLNDESREKLLGVLTAAQRKQLEELLGSRFDWQPAQGVGGVRAIGGAPAEKK